MWKKISAVCIFLLLVLFNYTKPGVPKGSLVATRNSSTGFKPIERFTIFDNVACLKNGEFRNIQVSSLLKFKSINVIIIKTSSGILCCSREARIFCVNKNSFISVKELSVGDKILSHELKSYDIEAVTDFQTTGPPISFYILSLNKVHNYFQADSNGTAFLMHNVYDAVVELVLEAPEVIPEIVKAAPVVAAATATVAAAAATGIADATKLLTHKGRVEARRKVAEKGAKLEKELHDNKLDKMLDNIYARQFPDSFENTHSYEERQNIKSYLADTPEKRERFEVMQANGYPLDQIASELGKFAPPAVRERSRKDKTTDREAKRKAEEDKKQTDKAEADRKADLVSKVKKKAEHIATNTSIEETIKQVNKNLDATETVTAAAVLSSAQESATQESAAPVSSTPVTDQGPCETLGDIVVEPIVTEEKTDTTSTGPEPIPDNTQTNEVPVDVSNASIPKSQDRPRMVPRVTPTFVPASSPHVNVPEFTPAPAPRPTPKASHVPSGPTFFENAWDATKMAGIGLGGVALGVGSALGTAAMIAKQKLDENEENIDAFFKLLQRAQNLGK